ncbi:MAG TPA: hypothetical protein VK692_03230 [Chthoniobacterales bacterium]|nr:hypothetical protein [Chthoniobacterales bacterium]
MRKAIEDEGRRRGRTEDAVKFLIVLVIVFVLGPVVRKAIEHEGRRRGRTEDAVKFLIVLVIVVVLGRWWGKQSRTKDDNATMKTRRAS